jgi:hypothetical protein
LFQKAYVLVEFNEIGSEGAVNIESKFGKLGNLVIKMVTTFLSY